MLRFDCYDFYKLGIAIHPLTELEDEAPLSHLWVNFYLAKDEINSFFNTFPLRTSRAPATQLFEALKAIVPDDLSDMKFKDEHDNPRVLHHELGAIKVAARELETVLKAELSGWDSLFVSQKGAFSTTELIGRAEMMIPETGRAILSPRAIADFRQAGMCLAFNLGTAAAFHAARSTEVVIMQYYEKLVGNLPSVKARNWGAYHRNLSKCPAADNKVLGWLKHLTEEYRNPVLHPQDMLSADDAIEFINACISLITSIARALAHLQKNQAIAQV